MDSNTLMWLWLIAGVGLSLSEFVVPGLIVVFLGMSAFVVAAGYKLGILESVLSGFTVWFATSLFSVFAIREFVKKLFPGEERRKSVNEDAEAYGSIVDIVDDVRSKDTEGRIRFRGTTWQATTSVERIPSGQKAKIVARDGLVWIVEPYEKTPMDEIGLVSDS